MKKLPYNSSLSTEDAARILADLARQNGWSTDYLWNNYNNRKHRLTTKERQRFYAIVAGACRILVWKL